MIRLIINLSPLKKSEFQELEGHFLNTICNLQIKLSLDSIFNFADRD